MTLLFGRSRLTVGTAAPAGRLSAIAFGALQVFFHARDAAGMAPYPRRPPAADVAAGGNGREWSNLSGMFALARPWVTPRANVADRMPPPEMQSAVRYFPAFALVCNRGKVLLQEHDDYAAVAANALKKG
ncbi:MAG: hypothetical protein ACREXX_07255 [Gammaproteobacteria bacterium]